MFFLYFMIFAAFSAAAHCYLHKVIGAPRIDKDGIASVTRGMIGSFYGVWLARSYNFAMQRHAQKIRGEVMQDLARNPGELMQEAEKFAHELDEPAPVSLGEYAIEYIIRCRLHATMPLFWQKAAGLCSVCTAFWLHSAVFWLLMYVGAFPDAGIGIVLMGWALFPPSAFFVQQFMASAPYTY